MALSYVCQPLSRLLNWIMWSSWVNVKFSCNFTGCKRNHFRIITSRKAILPSFLHYAIPKPVFHRIYLLDVTVLFEVSCWKKFWSTFSNVFQNQSYHFCTFLFCTYIDHSDYQQVSSRQKVLFVYGINNNVCLTTFCLQTLSRCHVMTELNGIKP